MTDQQIEGTGEPLVDAAIARLRDLDETPVAEHVVAYDEVHRLLQDALAGGPHDPAH